MGPTMTREELAELISGALTDTSVFNWATRARLMDVLLPVLADVWDEGYESGYRDGTAEEGMGWEPQNNQNPYEQVSA